MARNREKKHESLVHQVEWKLKSKLAIGQSKREEKKAERALIKEKRKVESKAKLSYEERITIHKIYSWGTFRDYQKHACYFVKWCKENYNCKTVSECRKYVDEWLLCRSALSVYTLKLEASSLAKLYDCTTNDFIKTGVRHRSDITRSRKKAKRDKNFSKTNNKEFIDFCKGTGLRKHDISSGYRTIPLTDKAKKILEEVIKLSPDSEYLFTRENGERMTSRSFNYWLSKYCRDAGISFKSSHCIRRTFASRLFAASMPLSEISVYMGHEDIETTKGYIYNYHEIEQNRSYMNKAL